MALILLLIGRAGVIAAQCTPTVSTYPYNEGFETSAAWTSGGTGDDWAWGTPGHPLISSAAEGTKAWCVGGLTGTFYTYGEQSWLESPCFDFSTLSRPYVRFAVFWECERTYDGVTFQYSLNNGTTWSNVGSYTDPAQCLTENWFNASSINNLGFSGPADGWSGRVGGSVGSCAGGAGSGAWVYASHCLDGLGGEPAVKFRFAFGAGTFCNDYDGVAIDAIQIAEGAIQADFIQQCSGSEVTFQDATVPCVLFRTWDFGDPGSGAANTSTSDSPSHTYAVPGTYTITLTATGPCGGVSVVTRSIQVVDVAVETTAPTCTGILGTAAASVTGGAGPFTYAWTPGGQTTASISGLNAGDYTVTVSGTGVCQTSVTATIIAAAEGPTVQVSATDVSCNGLADGTASVVASDGTPGYTYAWTPSGGTAATASGLSPGPYTCTVTDAAGCTTTAQAIVNEPAPLIVIAEDDRGICTGATTTMSAEASGGTGPYTYAWSPEGPEITPSVASTYVVTVTDANGCTSAPDDVTISVDGPEPPVFTVDEPVGCTPHCVYFTLSDIPPGGLHTWDLGDGAVENGPGLPHCYATSGVFDVSVTFTDVQGCQSTYTLPAAVEALPTPVAAFTATPPITTIEQPTIAFMNTSTDAQISAWSFGDAAESTSEERDPVFTYNAVGCYTVRLVVSRGTCAAETEAQVCVEDAFVLFAPNAFTPDGDGINEAFGVATSVRAAEEFELSVYDRWGRQLYATTEPDAPWTGEGVPLGVYLWRLRLIDTLGKEQQRSGHVTLLR